MTQFRSSDLFFRARRVQSAGHCFQLQWSELMVWTRSKACETLECFQPSAEKTGKLKKLLRVKLLAFSKTLPLAALADFHVNMDCPGAVRSLWPSLAQDLRRKHGTCYHSHAAQRSSKTTSLVFGQIRVHSCQVAPGQV